MKVSIIIPTYNRAHLIIDTLYSIFEQTMTDYEIIIVDDGSTDKTYDVLHSYMDRIRYYYQDNQGVSAARNKGISEAQGDYITFLDSDDRYLPTKLKIQSEYLDHHKDVGMVYCGYQIEQNNQILYPPFLNKPSGDHVHRNWLFECNVGTPTVMFRKEVVSNVGGFDEEMSIAEDVDLWIRIAQHYPVFFIPERLVIVYLHSSNTVLDPANRQQAHFRIIDKNREQYSYYFMRRVTARAYYRAGHGYLENKKLLASCQSLFKGLFQTPFDALMPKLILRLLIRIFLPITLQDKIRNFRHND